MKKGYWIVAYHSVADSATMKTYAGLAGEALKPFNARLLAGPNDTVSAFEAGLQQPTVIVEFESYQKAIAAYESKPYRHAVEALGPSVKRDFRIVEGVED